MWKINYNKKFSYAVYSQQNALDPYTGSLESAPNVEQNLTVDYFSNSDATLTNTVIVNDPDNPTSNVISLSLPSKIVNFVIDKSGSMSWNDPDNRRLTLLKRFVNKVSATYPGDITYNITTYAGKKVNFIISAVLLANNTLSPTYNASRCYTHDVFINEIDNFYGIRILRNSNRFPTSPIDGDILFDGNTTSFVDANIQLNSDYYYTVYTFDENYNFSSGVDLAISINNNLSIPPSLKNVDCSILKGSGILMSDSTAGMWCFDEGHGEIVYDFSAINDFSLESLSDVYWLDKDSVPVGQSGLRLDSTSYVDTIATSYYRLNSSNKSFLLWVKPFESGFLERGLFSRSDGVDLSYICYINANNGMTFEIQGGVNVSSDNNVINYDEWNAIVCTVNTESREVLFYVNGVSCGGGILATLNTFTGAASLNVGRGFNLIDNLFGDVAAFSVHDYIFSNSDISTYSKVSNNRDDDNGERLLVVDYAVDNIIDFSRIKAVINDKKIYHELDGTDIFYDDISVGDSYITYNLPYLSGTLFYFTVFTENDIGNYSSLADSPNFYLQIPPISNTAFEFIDDVVSETISVQTIAGINKNYLKYNLSQNDQVTRVQIYYSTDSYPSYSNRQSNGSLVYNGLVNDEYVHRALLNNQSYYYTIVGLDKFGRNLAMGHASSIPSNITSDIGIPLLEIKGCSYRILSDLSVRLEIDQPDFATTVSAYFDEDIVLISKLLSENGEVIIDNALSFSYEIKASSYEYDSILSNVFDDNSDSIGDLEDLITISTYYDDDGLIKAISHLNIDKNIDLFNNVKFINYDIVLKVATLSQEEISIPVKIKFKNPLELHLLNRDSKFIDKKYQTINSANIVSSTSYKYNGSYILSSTPFIVRCMATYKGKPLTGTVSINARIYDTIMDLSDPSVGVQIGDESKTVTINNDEYYFSKLLIDDVDADGNLLETTTEVSVVDLIVPCPETPQNVVLFAKIVFNGLAFIKDMSIVFDNVLQIDVTPSLPVANGIDVAEQIASVYMVNPDNPDDKSLRTYPADGSIVSWELIPIAHSYNRLLYSDEDINTSNIGGIYSLTTDGIAKKVFFGPYKDVQIIGNVDGTAKYEEYKIAVSCLLTDTVFGQLTAEKSCSIQLDPEASKSRSSRSHFLMEFDNIKNELWSDGRNYLRLKIARDANMSTSKYSSVFRSSMSQVNKTIFELIPGSMVFISTNDADVEIISGDVTEYMDAYTGEWLLDTTSSTIGYGSSFVEITEEDETYVYFRYNKDLTQSSNGFETSSHFASNFDKKEYFKYTKEITVNGSINILRNGILYNLLAGGDIDSGLPPCIIVPYDPLVLNPLGVKVDNSLVDSFIVDGISENNIIIDASFSGLAIPDSVEAKISVNNYSSDSVEIVYDSVLSKNSVDVDFSNDLRTYLSIPIKGLHSNKNYDADIIVSISYDKNKAISRTKTLGINLAYDVSDKAFAKDNNGEVQNVFAGSFGRIETPVGGNSWEIITTSSPATKRAFACAQNVNDEIFYIGGITASGPTSAVEKYNPLADSWQTLTAMPDSRFGAMSVAIGNDIYIMGGVYYDSNNRLEISSDVYRYDTVADSWSDLSSMPSIFSGIENTAYGIAFGVACSIGNIIYVLSGVRDISQDGKSYLFNDRVLSYDIVSDSWSYSDVIEAVEFYSYYRLGASAKIDGNIIYVIGGCIIEDDETQPLSSIYSYDVSTAVLFKSDNAFASFPDSVYFGAFTQIGTDSYLIGGRKKDYGYSDNSYVVDANGSLTNPIYNVTTFDDFNYAVNAASAVPLSIAGTDYIYLLGGLGSGRGQNFVKLDYEVPITSMKLNDIERLGFKVVAKNDANDFIDNLSININGYLQNNVSDYLLHYIKNDLANYPIIFEQSSQITDNGYANFVLSPRGFDVIEEITASSDDIANKIVLSCEVDDTSFYGKIFVNFVADYPAHIPVESSLSLRSNLFIQSLASGNGSFSLLSEFLSQHRPVAIDCKKDGLLVNDIDYSYSDMNATSAIAAIDNLMIVGNNGPSPLYDAMEGSSILYSAAKYDDIRQVHYIIGDAFPNHNVASVSDAYDSIISINSSLENPIVFCNFMYRDSDRQLELFVDTIDLNEINKLANKTKGGAYSIFSSSVEDDVLGIITGRVTGSLGYGKIIYHIDLGKIVTINKIAALFNLLSNSDANWKITVSEDGYNYSAYTVLFPANYEANFIEIYGRYIKFEINLYSGLSIGNEEAYEGISLPYQPSLSSLDLSYTEFKEDYLYLNKESINNNLEYVVAIATSNVDAFVGVNVSDVAIWNDFNVVNKKSLKVGGNVVIPQRYSDIGNATIEPLIFMDGFIFSTSYGAWPQDATVAIYDKDKNIIDSSFYSLKPRDGWVIFNHRRSGQHFIKIQNSNNLKIGVHVINKSPTESAYLYNMGFFYVDN
ncbi:MAG: kelch repeat-containing protein [Phenylobacterium sp.]